MFFSAVRITYQDAYIDWLVFLSSISVRFCVLHMSA